MRVLFFFLCLALASTTSPVVAKKMYKYQDASGNWVFTDKPPDGSTAEVETEQLEVSGRPNKLTVRRRGSESEPMLYIVNEYFGPVEVEISLNNALNVESFPPLPKRFIVPGASEIRAVTLRPQKANASWRYQTQYRATLGDPNASHKPEQPYRVPFETGRSFPISQGFNGAFTHNTPGSQYAVDFAMPEGTDIYAAREGRVMEVANDFFSGGAQEQFMQKANLVRILHKDGSMAVYGHLRLESARVTPGTRVKRGQRIGKSGNTGFSTGPHLHFVVQLNQGLTMRSVPFEFAGENGQAVQPREHTQLTAY
jgi:murein DD-endopeptidase MepM/ murein hydrolase activator NlpD